MMKFVRNRLREPSTWRALAGLTTLGGVSLTVAQIDAISAAGVAIYLAVELLLPDRVSVPDAADAARDSDSETKPLFGFLDD